jgi:peptidoglycan/xylan/chitin deacetylase (PgdA/CDA1 family)
MSLLTEEPLVPALADIRLPNPPCFVPHGRPRRTGLKDYALAALGSVLNTCLGPREKLAFGILMYHRVCEEPDGHPRPTWNVTPERFEQQLKGLLARGWQAWPLRQALSCVERNLPIPRKTFVVTFDDGYANNLIHAAPVLTKLHVPATLFLATAYLDSKQPFPSDDWPVAGQPGVPSETWRPLTTEECRRLTANGLVELGAHTHTHADFRNQPDALAADLAENLAVLHERFGVESPPFAFPYGTKATGFATPELAAAARETGVVACLTTDSDLVRPGDSPFDWGRFTAHHFDSAGSLAAKLGGWHNVLRLSAKRAIRRSTPGS